MVKIARWPQFELILVTDGPGGARVGFPFPRELAWPAYLCAKQAVFKKRWVPQSKYLCVSKVNLGVVEMEVEVSAADVSSLCTMLR